MYLSKNLEDVKSSCEFQPTQSIILNGQRNFGSVGAKEPENSGDIAQGDFGNLCSASPRDFIGEVFGGKAKPKKQSIELSYSQYLNRSGNYCAMDNGESVAAYVWESSHWGRFSDSAGKRMALNWLQANEPQKATHTAACSLHNTSVLAMPLIPSEPNQTVVPMKNVWLTVSDDGKFTIKRADKTWGVKYVIDAELPLDGKREKMQYEPKTLPEDSLFHQFLSVSLPDEEVRALVQEYCGYTLLNDVRHQVAQIWVGDGRNGKSVLLKIIQKLHAKVGCHSHGLAPFQGNEFWKRMAQKFPDMQEKKKPDSKGARLRAVNLTFGNHPVN